MVDSTAQPEADATGDRWWRVRHLPVLVAVSAVLVVVAAVVGGVAAGGTGAAGAAAGVAVVTVGYVLSTLVVAWADSVHPRLVLPFGLAVYTAKLSLIGGVSVALAATGWAGLVPFGLGIAAGGLGWTGVHIWWIGTGHARR